MRKIGILTGGGDCPGLNAVIRGVVEKCAEAGMEVFGFRDGWRGALNAKGHWLTLSEVEGIQTLAAPEQMFLLSLTALQQSSTCLMHSGLKVLSPLAGTTLSALRMRCANSA